MFDSVAEDDACCWGISVCGKTAAVVSDKKPLAMTDNDNYEDRSSTGEWPNEKADVDTTHGEDESKPSNAECISQNNRKTKKNKKAFKGTESAENNTEERETKNEEQTSQGGIWFNTDMALCAGISKTSPNLLDSTVANCTS